MLSLLGEDFVILAINMCDNTIENTANSFRRNAEEAFIMLSVGLIVLCGSYRTADQHGVVYRVQRPQHFKL